jgi:hypothetical protein
MRTILVMLFLISPASVVLASDGVLEINHTCAVQMGCSPNDGPGRVGIISSLFRCQPKIEMSGSLQSRNVGLL